MDTKNKECTVSATQATSKQAESSEIESAPFSKDNDSGSLSSKETGKGTDDPLIAAASDGRTQGEKATIDAAVKNYEESHARFDDPVEPPARNAPKNFAAQELEALENDPSVTFLPMNTKSILTRLFDPDRKQKPQLWDHIKLVAPGPADQPPDGCLKWKSKDAVAAYCLKCRKQFTYTRGTSKTVSRHMQAYHGFDWNDEKEPSTGKRAASAAKTPPLKKRKPETEQSAQMALLRWIVSSFQPWSTVESPVFQDFACCLCASFDVPTKDEMISIAIENVEKVKVEVRRRLKDCDKYSIGCLPFTHQNKAYTSVTVTFCTPTFERETVSLGLITGKCTTATVTSLLSEFSLSPNNVSCVTVTGGPEHTNLGIGRHGVSCVLFRMEKIVEEECKSNVATNGVISFVLSKFSPMCSTSFVQRLYTSLQTALGSDIDWDGNAGQKMVARALSSILKPFYDANITLSGELYPTVGLTIPVSRRIRDIVSKLDVAQLTTECNDKTAVFRIKEFCTSLLKQFSASFGSVLAEDPVLMWTVPLDPRLIHMGGLSKNEQESVTKMLVDKVKEKKRAATDANVASAEGAEDNGGSKVLPKAQESSTMGGIFWGDDAQDAANQNEAEATYAKSNVDRYFTSVKSQRRIEDPLDWWNTNQQDFPELAGMAREWLAASAVGPSVDEREKYPEGNIELMAFLHDNAHLIAGFDDKKTSKTSQKK